MLGDGRACSDVDRIGMLHSYTPCEATSILANATRRCTYTHWQPGTFLPFTCFSLHCYRISILLLGRFVVVAPLFGRRTSQPSGEAASEEAKQPNRPLRLSLAVSEPPVSTKLLGLNPNFLSRVKALPAPTYIAVVRLKSTIIHDEGCSTYFAL